MEENLKSFVREFLDRQELSHRETAKSFSRILSVSKDLDQLIPQVLLVLKDTFHVSRIGLYLDERSTGRYNLVGSIGIPDAIAETATLDAESKLVKRLSRDGVILRKENHLLNDPDSDFSELHREIDAVLCRFAVPLFVKGKLVGILVLNDKVTGVPFGDSDLEFLFSLCSQIAVAVENARLVSDIRIQNQYLDTVLNDVASAVISIDQTGRIKTFNPKAEEILGLASAQVLTKDLSVLPNEIAGPLRQTLQENKSFYRKEILLPPNGRPAGISTSQLKEENGNVMGVVAVFADLTKIHKQREEMRHKDQLQFVNKVAMRSSHDLKNSLVSIRTFSQLLPDKYNDKEFRTDFYNIVSHEVDRLTVLVDNLNFFAQPLKLFRVESDLNELIQESLSQILKEDLEKIVIEKEFLLSRPQVWVDPENMKKVFLNLIRNSVQAMTEGGTLKIKAFDEKKNGEGPEKEKVDFIQIHIQDNGTGMPAEEIQQAFEPFYTVKNRGIGLGLTLVKKIIEAHGGTISIESEAGKGTDLILRIPRSNPSAKQEQQEKQEPDTFQTHGTTTKNLNR